MTWVIVVIAVCVLMEGVCSGAEIGFYSVNRLRLRSRVEEGRRGARVLQSLVEKPDATIMTTLIGTNVMVYSATALATEMLSTRPHAEFLATLIMTPIVFFFGEMIPKDIFRRRADVLMYRLAGSVDALRVVLWPVTAVLRRVASVVTGRIPVERRAVIFSRAALREWIAEGAREGVLSAYQQVLSANVMGLLKKPVAEVMIPLERAATIDAELAGDALRTALRQAGHSRLPLLSASSRSVLGILHALDFISAKDPAQTAAELARPAVKVKSRDGVHAVLRILQRERQQMAVVVNREGKPIGIVTIKDLIEEIVGELEDF